MVTDGIQPEFDNAKKSPDGMQIFFGKIPATGTQEAVDGIRFDFNDGLRVFTPDNGKNYLLRFNDLDTKSLLYEIVAPPNATVVSLKKYYVNFRLVISEPETDKLLFMHDFNAKDQTVMIQFPVHTLGDSIGWFSYVERFQEKSGCKIVCVTAPWFSEIVKKQYPAMRFITREECEKESPYACYKIGLFEIGDTDCQPIDHRYVGLHRLAAHILGVDDADTPPRFDLSAPRKIKGKYVCIAVQSTNMAKCWNHPGGWEEVVAFLKKRGYRVLCIDRDRICRVPGGNVRIPDGAEDFTGDKPLQERIDLLKDAEFFIGLSSGLSWLAWGCRVPVVLISGFTKPVNEFYTPYRIINRNVCNGCWNDFKEFDLSDFWQCPRHAGTMRRFECGAMITPEYVIANIERLLLTIGGKEK